MLKHILFLFVLVFCFSCGSSRHFVNSGASEFVKDSRKIAEGKFSILEMEGVNFGSLPRDAMEEYEERVSDGDILNIAVYHPSREDLMTAIKNISENIGFQVTNGQVGLPDLPPLTIQGLTIEEASQKLREMYSREIKDIDVFISYKDRLVRKVELAGMVNKPYVPVDGRMRLYELLSIAHIPEQANLFKSYVIRDNKILPVDMTKLMKNGDMSQNIVMHAKDKVFIASSDDSRVMVMGEVNRPLAIPMTQGTMSLREAIVQAGGIPYTGNQNHIQVIRGSIVNPKIYTLHWKYIVHLPNSELLLIPGDVVYVSAKPITKWNRFINQLLPSFGGASTAFGTYKMFSN
jgi:polysaccharide biosynthesis/export protein